METRVMQLDGMFFCYIYISLSLYWKASSLQ
jgi:hypothetical protein